LEEATESVAQGARCAMLDRTDRCCRGNRLQNPGLPRSTLQPNPRFGAIKQTFAHPTWPPYADLKTR